MQQFGSDNNAGICPEALAALLRANAEPHATGYGDDAWTSKACILMRELFETDCEVFFVFNGTAANSLALAALTKPYQSIITHEFSHIATDECGAPEHFTGGSKLLTVAGDGAKVSPADIERLAKKYTGLHAPKPKAVSITQSTEVGTVYTVPELHAVAESARRHGFYLHMDGARFANAVAHLKCGPADASWRAGVDVLSFGGTKNGLAVGEAVVFFRKELAEDFAWRVKQAGQLASKMRLVSAPWVGLLENGAWLKHAAHANAMATRLYERIRHLPGIRIMHPVDANGVFADIPPAAQASVREKGWRFYTFIGETGCRLMCAWDTTPDTVDRFAADLSEASRV